MKRPMKKRGGHVIDIDTSYGSPMSLAFIHRQLKEKGLDPIKDAERIFMSVEIFPKQVFLSEPRKPVRMKTLEIETYINITKAKK